jgi:hypothetical protein
MIQSVLYREEGRYTGYSAAGHSGYAEAGSDIVCAGVSALSITCVNALESLLGVQVEPRVDEVSGLLSFLLPRVAEEKESGVQLLMGALGVGMQSLSEAYPDYVTFDIQDRRK